MDVNMSFNPPKIKQFKMESKMFLTLLQHLKNFVRAEVLKGHEILKDGTCYYSKHLLV